MKHHITKEQWGEISDEHKNKMFPIDDIRIPVSLDEQISNECRVAEFVSGQKVNIGFMMWLLENELLFINKRLHKGLFFYEIGCIGMDDIKNRCLCDALWEAVKYKLKV